MQITIRLRCFFEAERIGVPGPGNFSADSFPKRPDQSDHHPRYVNLRQRGVSRPKVAAKKRSARAEFPDDLTKKADERQSS